MSAHGRHGRATEVLSGVFMDLVWIYPLTRRRTGNHANFFVLFPLSVCNDCSLEEIALMEQSRDELNSPESGTPSEAVPSRSDVTQWLAVCREGDTAALEGLLPLVYDQLHRQAMRAFSRERPGHTLQPTALVNEVYLRMTDQHEMKWQKRAQVFRSAAQLMPRL